MSVRRIYRKNRTNKSGPHIVKRKYSLSLENFDWVTGSGLEGPFHSGRRLLVMFFGADSKKNKSVFKSDELRFKKNVERSPKQRLNSLLWADRHSDDNP